MWLSLNQELRRSEKLNKLCAKAANTCKIYMQIFAFTDLPILGEVPVSL